jgi:hypothetical protein
VWNFVSRIKDDGLSVLEKRALRRIFEPLRNEIVASRRKLYNEEVLNLCSFINITRLTKSRWMSWTWNVL